MYVMYFLFFLKIDRIYNIFYHNISYIFLNFKCHLYINISIIYIMDKHYIYIYNG